LAGRSAAAKRLLMSSLSCWDVATPDADFFWKQCSTYTALLKRTVYTARYVPLRSSSTTSSTPAEPKPQRLGLFVLLALLRQVKSEANGQTDGFRHSPQVFAGRANPLHSFERPGKYLFLFGYKVKRRAGAELTCLRNKCIKRKKEFVRNKRKNGYDNGLLSFSSFISFFVIS
jgi:hypothetical protein